MSGLAQIAIHNGAKVSGSDLSLSAETDKLQKLGAKICLGHHAENITPSINLLIHTSAVKENNPELVKARDLGIQVMERAEFLGIIASGYKKVIAVAGTHGKTTTTAMLAEIFTLAGRQPTIHLGGESIGLKGNTIIGTDEYFIVEACEYKESFRFLRPYIGIITNIEADHLDYYKDYEDIRSAFVRFASRSEKLISLAEDKLIHSDNQTINDVWAVENVEFTGNGYTFEVYHKGKFFYSFRINMIGRHNVTNSLFAIATAYECGIAKDIIKQSLEKFRGVERRYEQIYQFSNGCKVIIDYAHHPTELDASIKGISDVFSRILYVFQPHTYTRTKALFGEFLNVLNKIPNLVIFATYPARETIVAGGTAMDLYREITYQGESKNKTTKEYFDEVGDLSDFLDTVSDNFDCILVLGAGDLAEKLKKIY